MFSRVRNVFPGLVRNLKFGYGPNGPNKLGKEKVKTGFQTKEQTHKNKEQSYIHIGLYGLVFALCFAALPLYRTFCEHMGLVGNNDKKTYDFKNQKIANLKKYNIKFIGQPQSEIDWEFEPIQREVVVGASQTAIVFYRLRNREKRPIVGFSTYNISPEQANIYFSKIQCFCFNQQMINPQQQLLLPLFFYLQPEINDDPDVSRIHQITVIYQFLESTNQDLAKFAAEQLERIQQNKRKLTQMRASKKNMSVQKYEQHVLQQQTKGDDQPLIIQKKLPTQSKVAQPPRVQTK